MALREGCGGPPEGRVSPLAGRKGAFAPETRSQPDPERSEGARTKTLLP